MKSKEQMLKEVRLVEYESQAIDSRDFSRLSDFYPSSDWKAFGFTLKEGEIAPPVREWTEANILEQVKKDLSFAFEKALDCRGISAHSMYSVVKMWMYVLEDSELAGYNSDDYTYYGLPFLKKVAVKYNLPNEIGDDNGDEEKYSGEVVY